MNICFMSLKIRGIIVYGGYDYPQLLQLRNILRLVDGKNEGVKKAIEKSEVASMLVFTM